MSQDLPAAPDRWGQPRPPAAPSVVASLGSLPRVGVSHLAPWGDGPYASVGGDSSYPTLETVAAVRPPAPGRALAVAAGVLALPVAALAVYLLLNGADLATFVVAAVVAAVLALFFAGRVLLAGGSEVIEVAARGVATRDPSAEVGAAMVDLYLLSEVVVREEDGGAVLEMRQRLTTDARTARVALPLGVLEASPEAWALVHLGIRHSEARGASIDDRTRARLELPAGPTTDGGTS